MSFLNLRTGSHQWLLVFSIVLFVSCQQKKKLIKSPKGYNFSQVQTLKLDIRLKEISGLVWDNERDEFLAHYDEAGKLYVLDKATLQVVNEYPFGAKGDYEDIALYNGVPYVLRSDGMITRIIRDNDGVRGVEAGKLGITGTNDFETMYTDTTRKALIIVCKNCDMDKKSEVSAFAFYPDSGEFDVNPVFRINADSIRSLSPHKTSKFQPSAARIHPKLQKLFIISSAANQLVVADLDGNPEAVYELGKKLFPQPEGLTFKSDGSMYISNEGVTSRATVNLFRYITTP